MSMLEAKTPSAFWDSKDSILANDLSIDLSTLDADAARIHALADASAGMIVEMTGHDWTADETVSTLAKLAFQLELRSLYYAPDAVGDGTTYNRDYDFTMGLNSVITRLYLTLSGGVTCSKCRNKNFPGAITCARCGGPLNDANV